MDNIQRVSPEWDVSIQFTPLGFRDLYRCSSRNTVRVIGDGRHQEAKLSRHNRTDELTETAQHAQCLPRSKPDGLLDQESGHNPTFLTHIRYLQWTTPHKEKLVFSTGVPLGVQTKLKDMTVPSSRWPTEHKIKAMIFLEGFFLLVICLVIFFLPCRSFAYGLWFPMLCFYGISVSASVGSLHLYFFVCVCFALSFLPCLFVCFVLS